MDGGILDTVLLYVLVCGADIAVARLVSCHYHTYLIGKVSDAGVLKAVELVAVIPVKGFTHLLPTPVELVSIVPLLPRSEILTEEVVVAGLGEDVKVKHGLDDDVIQAYLGILVVLRELLADKDGLVLDADVLNLQMTQLTGADEGVVLHETGKVELLVVLLQVLHHLFQHGGAQILAVLVVLGHDLDTLDGVLLDILSLQEELGKSVEPATVVVPRPRTALPVKIYPVDEVVAEALVKLIDILDRQDTGFDELQENVHTGAVAGTCLSPVHPLDIFKIFAKTLLKGNEASALITANPRIPAGHELFGDSLDDFGSSTFFLS